MQDVSILWEISVYRKRLHWMYKLILLIILVIEKPSRAKKGMEIIWKNYVGM